MCHIRTTQTRPGIGPYPAKAGMAEASAANINTYTRMRSGPRHRMCRGHIHAIWSRGRRPRRLPPPSTAGREGLLQRHRPWLQPHATHGRRT